MVAGARTPARPHAKRNANKKPDPVAAGGRTSTMQKTHLCRTHLTQMLFVGVIIGLMMFNSACGDDGHAQQQASRSRAKLDHLLQQAREIGIPLALLQPIFNQEMQLSSSSELVLNTQSDT